MSRFTSLTVIIPAYNEGPRISKVVQDSLDVIRRCADRGDILLIDDGSQDDTRTVLQSLSQSHPEVKWSSHARNKGFGSTLKELLLTAPGDWVAFLPGDGQIPPQEILKMAHHANGFDLLIGCRRPRQDPWKRRLMSWLYNVWVSVIAGQRLVDVDGALLIRRPVLDGLVLNSEGLFIQGELCAKTRLRGFKIGEVVISHRHREGGRPVAIHWKSLFQTYQDTARFLLRDRWVALSARRAKKEQELR